MAEDLSTGAQGDGRGLRLVWVNPNPPRPRAICLAQAIERHLAGRDGLSDEDFLQIFSGRRKTS